jgi:glycosyltransferase involved in cell wall biosynthesis
MTTSYYTTPTGRPIRVAFVTTNMTVGGEETLLVNLIRKLDREHFAPELVCLKARGELGEILSREIPVADRFLPRKWDPRVLFRLARHFRQRQIDAVITVGTGGDRMFWGRLAAWKADVPVILSAIHSTGWPTYIEWPNRRLQWLTDGFIAVAEQHAQYLIQQQGCPAHKVHVINNGVDCQRFSPRPVPASLVEEFGLQPGAPVAGILAVLRPEKNHPLFLRVASRVYREFPDARFLIVGDGQCRGELEKLTDELGLRKAVIFCGQRDDVPELINTMDVLLLTSRMEANPVSVLEAQATETPVVASHVGSLEDTILNGRSGYLVDPTDEDGFVRRVLQLFAEPLAAKAMGKRGRRHVESQFSLKQMVQGYEQLIQRIYLAKCDLPPSTPVETTLPEVDSPRITKPRQSDGEDSPKAPQEG